MANQHREHLHTEYGVTLEPGPGPLRPGGESRMVLSFSAYGRSDVLRGRASKHDERRRAIYLAVVELLEWEEETVEVRDRLESQVETLERLHPPRHQTPVAEDPQR